MGGAFWKLGAGKRVVTCRVRGQACSIQLGQPDCRHVGGRGRVRASAREAPEGQLGREGAEREIAATLGLCLNPQPEAS